MDFARRTWEVLISSNPVKPVLNYSNQGSAKKRSRYWVLILILAFPAGFVVFVYGAVTTQSRACGSFPVDVKVGAVVPSFARARFITTTSLESANRFAEYAKVNEVEDGFQAAVKLDDGTITIEVPFSIVRSFYGVRTRNIQPTHATIVISLKDGSRITRVVLLPKHGYVNGPVILNP